MDEIFVFLLNFGPLTEPLKTALTGICEPVSYKKGQYLMTEGGINRYMFFLNKGLVNCFYTDKKGRQKTTMLLREGQLIAFAESYYRQTPNFYNVQAIEDCEVQRLTFEDLDKIYLLFPMFERTGRLMTMTYNFMLSHKVKDLMMSTVAERYKVLATQSPELVQRVPVLLLASYLNTTRSHFTRIRKAYEKRAK